MLAQPVPPLATAITPVRVMFGVTPPDEAMFPLPVTDVTVPLPLPVHTPLIEKQPFARLIPFEAVDVAVVPVRLR